MPHLPGTVMLAVGTTRYGREKHEGRYVTSKGSYRRWDEVKEGRETGIALTSVGGVLSAYSAVSLLVGAVLVRSPATKSESTAVAISGAVVAVPASLLLGLGVRVYHKYNFALHPEAYRAKSSVKASLNVAPLIGQDGVGLQLGGLF